MAAQLRTQSNFEPEGWNILWTENYNRDENNEWSLAQSKMKNSDLEQTPVVSSDKTGADLSHSWYKEGFKIANEFQSR